MKTFSFSYFCKSKFEGKYPKLSQNNSFIFVNQRLKTIITIIPENKKYISKLFLLKVGLIQLD